MCSLAFEVFYQFAFAFDLGACLFGPYPPQFIPQSLNQRLTSLEITRRHFFHRLISHSEATVEARKNLSQPAR
ncbi:hypothetical protein RHOFW104R8_05880 [Rhodanobacter sp. FW104-R8]|nr:hypothetical protein RHOFW104R8_05880 [Rhodanobacter sp. FW104-R8]KZC26447.1 hypothetical protein RhoFW510T8_02365 [Rhodanobacter sp. FW510-T8]